MLFLEGGWGARESRELGRGEGKGEVFRQKGRGQKGQGWW